MLYAAGGHAVHVQPARLCVAGGPTFESQISQRVSSYPVLARCSSLYASSCADGSINQSITLSTQAAACTVQWHALPHHTSPTRSSSSSCSSA